MHPLLAYYYGTHPDDRGRTLAETLRQDDLWFEVTHDYIQWLFPLRERSAVNVAAPLVDLAVKEQFLKDPLLQDHLRAAFHRMLAFYGLMEIEGRVRKAAGWDARKRNWFLEDTHNNLRLTRILKSLALLGLRSEALALLQTLEELKADPDCGIGEEAFRFWRAALNPA